MVLIHRALQVRGELRQSIRTGEYFEMFKEMAYCQATSSFTFPLFMRSMREVRCHCTHSMLQLRIVCLQLPVRVAHIGPILLVAIDGCAEG